MGQKLRGDRVFRLRGFRSGAYLFLQTILSFLQRRQIGEHQFGIDYFNVTNRVNSSADVMNIGILKATDDLYNRVYLANMTEELIAETFAHARAFDETSDINELNRGRHNFLGMRDLSKSRQARIWHGDDADVWINRAKWIILGGRLVGACNRIEKR